MRELRSCDFCESDAAGVYEALPPELDPSEDEQRRIVLCEECRGTLETVLEPLVSRASAGADQGERTESRSDGTPETATDVGSDGLTGESSDVVAERVDEAEPETAESESDAESDETDPTASSGADSPRRPEGYRKVLRLLGNRDGALSRQELAELVGNAYGLSEDQCERVIDTALSNGDLVEEGSQLQRA